MAAILYLPFEIRIILSEFWMVGFQIPTINIFGAPNFQARYSLKYDHSCGALLLKMTDDVVCLQFKSDVAQVTTFIYYT